MFKKEDVVTEVVNPTIRKVVTLFRLKSIDRNILYRICPNTALRQLLQLNRPCSFLENENGVLLKYEKQKFNLQTEYCFG